MLIAYKTPDYSHIRISKTLDATSSVLLHLTTLCLPITLPVIFGAESGRLMFGTLDGGKLAPEELASLSNMPLDNEEHGLHWNIQELLQRYRKVSQ